MDHHERMWAKAAKASLIRCDHSYGSAMESETKEGLRAGVVREMEDQDNLVIRKDREEKV